MAVKELMAGIVVDHTNLFPKIRSIVQKVLDAKTQSKIKDNQHYIVDMTLAIYTWSGESS